MAPIALLLALSLLASSANAVGLVPASAAPEPAYVVHLNGVIDPITSGYLTRAIDRAEREGAGALVVVLDTPGGLDTAMRAMTQRMLAATVPVVVYVAPSGARAASAGTFVTMAAHVAAMAPGTNIGAAHPVTAGGGSVDPVMAGKMANDAASTARALAAQRGRNADWADRAVRESVSATSAEALDLGVIDLVARDLDDLLDQIDGRTVQTAAGPRTLATRGAPRAPVDMTLAELLLHTLLSPDVAFILLNLGVFGLLGEFYHPGTLVPGLSGLIAILLALIALGTLPVNLGAALLVLLAFGLFVVDLHVAAHGVLSAAGVLAFLLGGLLLFSPIDVPPWQPGPIAVSPWLVGGFATLFAAYFLVVLRAALAARHAPLAARGMPGAGQLAVAVTDLRPSGVVHIGDEDWSAVAESAGVRAGEAVEIVAREGLHVRVRRAN